MSIPASNIVNVIPRVIAAGGNSLQINGLLVSNNPDVPVGKVLEFTSTSDIQKYFGSVSVEGRNAPFYFKGFDNSLKKPQKLFVVRHTASAVSAYLRGAGQSATMEQFRAISSGSLKINIDGIDVSLTGLNFSSSTTISEVAQVITTALDGNGVVTYSSLFNAFVLTSISVGGTSSVAYADDSVEYSIASLLGMREQDGGVISAGANARTIADTLELVIPITNNWVTFTTTWAATDDEIVAMRQWASSYGNRYWAVCWVPWDSKYLDPMNNTNHVANTLKTMDLGSGILVVGWNNPDSSTRVDDLAYALFPMGMAASVNYQAKVPGRGKIVYMFKSQEGLPYNCFTQSNADALETWGISFYGDWATANDNFKFFAHGNTWGKYPFMDTAIDAIWLNNEIQLSLMVLLNTALAIPYNPEGYARVRATLQGQDGPIYNALHNGVIRSGVELNQTQIDQINGEAGLEIAPTVKNTGYYLQILDPGASVRQQRGTPDISLWYTDAGGIQKIEMTSTVIL